MPAAAAPPAAAARPVVSKDAHDDNDDSDLERVPEVEINPGMWLPRNPSHSYMHDPVSPRL